MSSALHSRVILGWSRSSVKVRKVATSSLAKTTLVKVELEVSNSYDLADLIRDLHDARLSPEEAERSLS